ncbi:hypothetical protein SLS58_008529 [Diplodia intermedia]|uniref:Uncharacterized protein n=1 Tax=Diplodia intermedia TaxID=856260 RepID=A0ABR3TH26_9PEZI
MSKRRRTTSSREIIGTSESKRPSGEGGVESKRLACIFAKRHPSNTALDRVCLGPGFATVARLKEHLYRKHYKPIHCLRCLNIYGTESELQDHLNAPDRCPKADGSREIVGISASQIAELKKKTRAKESSEEERWRKVFTTVFPEVDEMSIPSPYCEAGIQFTHLAQLEDYLRIRTIPETERMLSANFKQIPAELTRQLPRMVLSVFEKLSTEYRLGERETARWTSQSSQAEREDHYPSEDSSNETSGSGPSATVKERQETTHHSASGGSSSSGASHSKAPLPNAGQYRPRSELSPLPDLGTWSFQMPAPHPSGPDEPFASLEFTELENLEADQIGFVYDGYLGLLGEIPTPKSHRDFHE